MALKGGTAAVVFLLMSSAAPAAWAQDASDLIERGIAMRDAGQDEAALRFFQQSWEARHSGHAQAQIALAEQALGRWVDAETHLTEALGDSHDSWVHRRRRELQSALVEIRAHVGQLEVQANVAGAELVVAGRVVGTLPMPTGLHVPTGSVTFTVRAEGFVPVTRTVSVVRQFPLRESVTLERAVAVRPVVREPLPASEPVAAPVAVRDVAVVTPPTSNISPRTPAQASSTQRYIGFGLIGAGAAALVVSGVFFAINAGMESSTAEATPLSAEPYGSWARFQANENSSRTRTSSEVCDLAQQRSGSDAAQVRDLCASNGPATIALVAGIAGGALAATGLVLALTARSTSTSTAHWGVTPWLARGLGGATLHATW